MKKRLGILGGTFDPIHLGHLASADETQRAFSLDRVLLMLSARPPHKPDREPAPVADRMAMLRIATAATPLIEPCDLEAGRAGLSYTVDTLRQLRLTTPDHELYLIMGIDAYREIDSWHDPAALLELANIIVTSRPGETPNLPIPEPPFAARDACCYDSAIGCFVHKSGHRLLVHRLQGVQVSASNIRERIRAGLPIEHLTGPRVAEYIRKHHLYEDRTT